MIFKITLVVEVLIDEKRFISRCSVQNDLFLSVYQRSLSPGVSGKNKYSSWIIEEVRKMNRRGGKGELWRMKHFVDNVNRGDAMHRVFE